MTHRTFIIQGMTCASCVRVNEQALKNLKGISHVSINLANKSAKISYDEEQLDFSDIKKVISDNGFSVEEKTHVQQSDTDAQTRKKRNTFLWSLIFSLPVFSMMFGNIMLGVSLWGVDMSMYVFLILSLIVVFGFGRHFHIKAGKSLLKAQFNMDTLVSLGTLAAFFYSLWAMFAGMHVYFEAAVAIITLINLGRYLEHKAKAGAGNAIAKLLELGVKQASVRQGTKIIQKDIDDIQIGEVIIVKAGEKIALDGEIISGYSHVDESMITGESIPVEKTPGMMCYGATINGDGTLEIRVSQDNAHGTLSKIIELVENAQSSKAPIEKIADTVSSIFVPCILLVSLITFITWMIVTSGDIEASLAPAIACLVIACPCALGLATPTAIMVGSGVGAKHGVLIKNAETLEKTKDIDVILFDKTGTLTEGKPTLKAKYISTSAGSQLESIALSLAAQSHHPLSQSIASAHTMPTLVGENIQEIKGKGMMGGFQSETYCLGNRLLFESIAQDIEEKLAEYSHAGYTPVLFGTQKQALGIFALSDSIKADSPELIRQLQAEGILVAMITGDTKGSAQGIARELGITKVHAEVLPEDKYKIVTSYQEQGKKVCFTGDGINDAPALSQSDLSIAMGTGSDVAIEASDIVLVQGDIKKVLFAIHLSRSTLRTIQHNLFWAFIYNSIGIPLAALGLLNPIFASFAMSMSSVSVIMNSLRLRKLK